MVMKRRTREMLPWCGLAVLLVAAGFAVGWIYHSPAPAPVPPRDESPGPRTAGEPPPLPVLGQVPDYTLTDQLGRTVSSASFQGKVRVVTFLFPYCSGYCPLIAHNLLTLERALRTGGMSDRVQLVAFDVDPEGTGPDQLRTFQQQYGWDPHDTRWEFLTGAPDEIRRIVTGAYGVDYRKVSDEGEAAAAADSTAGDVVPEPEVRNDLAAAADVDYDIIHNDLLAVVDTRGRIRQTFGEADRITDDQVVAVIRRLLAEAPARATP